MSNRRPSTWPLWLSWAALMILLALTTALAFAPFGRFNLPISLAIALAKAIVILAIFMELTKASRLVLTFAAAGVFWLSILMSMVSMDFVARGFGLRH